MESNKKKKKEYLVEIEELRIRLEEAEETLRAIQNGEVDALVVSRPQGDEVFTLESAETPYRVFVEAMNEGAATITPEGTILYCNNRFSEMLKTSTPTVIGSSVYRFIPKEHLALFQSVFQKEKGEESKIEIQFKIEEENRIPVYLSVTPLKGIDRPAFSVVAMDLTERKRLEEALLRSNAELELRVQERTEKLASEIAERKKSENAVRESESRFRAIFENSMDAIFVTDPRDKGAILFANPAACRMLGWTEEELIGKGREFILDVDDPKLPSLLQERTESGHIIGELTYKRKDGSRFPGELTTAIFWDKGEERAVAIIRDITERKRAEHALQQSETRSKLLSQAATRLLASPSPEKTIGDLCRPIMEHLDCQAFFNFLEDEETGRLRLNAFAGISEEEAREIEWLDHGLAVCGCVAQERRPIVAEDIRNSPDPKTDLVKSYGVQAYACHPLTVDGRFFGTLSFGTRTRTHLSSEDLFFMKTISDRIAVALHRVRIMRELHRSHEELEARVQERTKELSDAVTMLETEVVRRERLEAELRQSEMQIRSSASQILTAQEVERRRIAAELHDSVAGALTGIKFMVEKALQGCSLSGEVNNLTSKIKKTIEEIRRIMAALRPSVLDDLGVIAALGSLIREFNETYPHMTVTRELEIEESQVPDTLKTPIFRITQEGLNNVVKHSKADLVALELRRNGQTIELMIRDNGRGFDPLQVFAADRYTKGGLGLDSMRERAELSGGKFSIESSPGSGTMIMAAWPVESNPFAGS